MKLNTNQYTHIYEQARRDERQQQVEPHPLFLILRALDLYSTQLNSKDYNQFKHLHLTHFDTHILL